MSDTNELQIISTVSGGMNADYLIFDSLYLTKNEINYTCGTAFPENKYYLNVKTTQEDWNSLIAALDIFQFSKVNSRSCGGCADQPIRYVSVRHGKYYHSISFDSMDAEVLKPIKTFLSKLDEIHSKYKVLSIQ